MKKILISILICTLFSNIALAETKIEKFTVNPESIRGRLLSKNITLLQALNNVESSKNNVNMARAKLLPSINLGVLLPALANPTFLISAVTFLFPFLVPSNWLVLKQQKDLFEADKAAYKVLQLNILTSSLSMYFTYVNDQKVQKVINDQSDVLGEIYKTMQMRSDMFGNVSAENLNMASAQWEESKIRSSKLQELLVQEKAGLRTLLGLPLGSELTIEDIDLAPSAFESKTVYELADRSLLLAPESAQLASLLKAAKVGKYAKMFGFISQSSLAGTATNNSSPFGNLKASGNFSFGADNIVNIQISNNNIDAIGLRVDQLKSENEKTAEILVGQISEVKAQVALTAQALSDRLAVFEAKKLKYSLGFTSLQSLLLTQSQLADSYVANIKSDLDLKMQRLTLMRLAIDGDFSKIKGCTADAPDEDKKSIFHRKQALTLDELCQQQ